MCCMVALGKEMAGRAMVRTGKATSRCRVAAALLAVWLLASESFAQPVGGVQQVGIPSGEMDFVAAAQQSSQWCWAAAIQMVLGYHGVAITQQQIVARTYGMDWWGNLPDWAGSIEAITANLNNWSIDNYGQQYAVAATLNWGAPPPNVLINELWNRRPMIIGYRSGPNSGHAVVVTAATYSNTVYGTMIRSIVVRDPWPSPANIYARGRIEYDGPSLAQSVTAHWFISVARYRPPLGQLRPDKGATLALRPTSSRDNHFGRPMHDPVRGNESLSVWTSPKPKSAYYLGRFPFHSLVSR